MARLLVMVCCVLVSAGAPMAQSRDTNATADPISGTWTGEFVLRNDSSNRVQIEMRLKFDGKRAVSGTFTGLQSPGDVKSGTFDPQSGKLKLELGKQDGPAVLLVLDGTVVNGTASGHFTGEETGDFTLSKKTESDRDTPLARQRPSGSAPPEPLSRRETVLLSALSL